MGKGRKVQREWSKVPGGNNSSSEVSPKSDLQSDRTELPSRVKEARTGTRNGGENLQKSVLSSFCYFIQASDRRSHPLVPF